MEIPNFNLDELEEQQAEANQKKNIINSFGSIAKNFDAAPSAYDLLVKKTNVGSGNSGAMYDKAAAAVVDPAEKAKQKYALWEADQRAKLGKLNISKAEKDQEQFDPNSTSSQSFRKMIEAQFPNVVKSYGEAWNNVSAADQQNIFRPLQLKEQIEARKDAARIAAGQRDDAKASRDAEKQRQIDEKMQGLKTPFGLANTEDDAKKLKEAYESKSNFDNKLQEMIDLRKKHGGGTAMNREDVARAAQLSKDLLLEYKNMAKLGVLSSSDEKIINAIIPADPLAYNSPMAALRGEDPILSNMEKFKADAGKDFATKVATRTRAGVEGAAKPQRTVVKTQTNQKTGEKRIVYSDGSTEIVSNTAGR